MSAEQSKAVARRFFEELWNRRELDVADDIIAPDCVTHQLQSGVEPDGSPRGPEAVKHHVAEWLAGFPDLRFEVEQLVAEGEHVVSRVVARGTHAGTWQGVAPTGKEVSIRMVVTH
jgi:predicted ester cyclase